LLAWTHTVTRKIFVGSVVKTNPTGTPRGVSTSVPDRPLVPFLRAYAAPGYERAKKVETIVWSTDVSIPDWAVNDARAAMPGLTAELPQ